MVTPWSAPADAVLAGLKSRVGGLTAAEAAARRQAAPPRRGRSPWHILAGQFLNPLVGMLLVAAAISAPMGSWDDAILLVLIVLVSGGLGFSREYAAEDAVAQLDAMIRSCATLRRDGTLVRLPVEDVVPGDVVVLSAGATLPGDGRLLSANGLQMDESALTGESFPAAKRDEVLQPEIALSERANMVYQGTHVVSGAAEVVIVAIGGDTELGRVAERLRAPRAPTEFDLGLQRFGTLLMRVSLGMVFVIFTVNVLFHRSVTESLLFSIALAVGLVPELLPAIVAVNLAGGAKRLAAAEVIVKRLAGIEDLGAVEVLCSDKTGTLTRGRIRLDAALGPDGAPSAEAHRWAWLNATFESGYENPIDLALRESGSFDAASWARAGEIPYDFDRKRLSVVLEREGRRTLVCKGQLAGVLACCEGAEAAPIAALHAGLAEEGRRVLGVAVRALDADEPIGPAAERGLRFVGLLAFADPPREDLSRVLGELTALGVSLKVLTGDDHRVAAHLWSALRGRAPALMTGAELRALGTEALTAKAKEIEVFAEVDPVQKERVVRALRAGGAVVAYMGDGINDAPALRAADVGLSVEGATDVAREAADVVLRRSELEVVVGGIREGRRTMANTLKYVRYTTSANFGNMLSMAAASLFLPFLPLLPKQILLNNLLSDLPAMAVAGDAVDPEELDRPGRWRTDEVRSFMLRFGGLSSAFDIATFFALYALTAGDAVAFRSGWFVESLLTEVLVLFVLRTPGPIGRSRPGPAVLWSAAGVVVVTLALPYAPFAGLFGLTPLSAPVLGAVLGITVAYLLATEGLKRRRSPPRRGHRP